jgi:RHS repeat-associated protein
VKDSANVVLRSYEWDASNRLLAIQIPGAVTAGTKRTEFVYDGAGRRVRQLDKEHNGTAWATQSHWYYLWDGLELAQKREATTGNVLVNYFSNGEQQGGNSLVYLSDHLGSPRSWYRVSDGAVGSADYSAYGVRTVTATGPGVPERGYTGHLHHLASGLALAPYRAYDPALGRWISEDPIQERGGVNLYGYVKNNPLELIDLDGLRPSITTVKPAIGCVNDESLKRLRDTIAAANAMLDPAGARIFDVSMIPEGTMNQAYDAVKASDLTIILTHGKIDSAGRPMNIFSDGRTFSEGLRNVANLHGNKVKFKACGMDDDGFVAGSYGNEVEYGQASWNGFPYRQIAALMKSPPTKRPYKITLVGGPAD